MTNRYLFFVLCNRRRFSCTAIQFYRYHMKAAGRVSTKGRPAAYDLKHNTGRSSNGRTSDFGSDNGGSSPPRPANENISPFSENIFNLFHPSVDIINRVGSTASIRGHCKVPR